MKVRKNWKHTKQKAIKGLTKAASLVLIMPKDLQFNYHISPWVYSYDLLVISLKGAQSDPGSSKEVSWLIDQSD